ncbi:hypothetical protein KAX17_04005, partial [Candidatus Bipolaricaulota bacterium]|nr:hypothetical protein [Candidatus Bipolaricaulota bacterium]
MITPRACFLYPTTKYPRSASERTLPKLTRQKRRGFIKYGINADTASLPIDRRKPCAYNHAVSGEWRSLVA